MAVDTRDKRASALGVGRPGLFQTPTPDGTLSTLDRQQVCFSYRGIAAAAPSVDLEAVQATRLGLDGVPNTFFPDDVSVPAASTDLRDCYTYKTLICTRNEYEALISAVNDLNTQIDLPADLKIVICTRNAYSIPITTDNDYETNLGC